MLTPHSNPEDSRRNLRRERGLWHDGNRHPSSLGCLSCPDRALCGGLQLRGSVYDCLGFCCNHPDDCDVVCRYKPEEFAHRVREVGGFALDNIPRNIRLCPPVLPPLIPLIYHGSGRVVPFQAPAVCLPLYSVVQRQNGETRYPSAADLADSFGIDRKVPVILTGTARDGALERWWSLGILRRERIRALRALGITMVTTPNYSLFIDQPRWDDLHSIKRIAIVHEEFLSEGLPAALHVNARTDKDWERWRDFISARSEITHIAFEFATGAGWAQRTAWHLEKLMQMATSVGRPLHLIMRGGSKLLPSLTRTFADVSLLETSVFMKTKSRQRVTLSPSGEMTWRPSPTKRNESIDKLLTINWQVVSAAYAGSLSQRPLPLKECG